MSEHVEIVCVIDRSGSMEATKSDAIGSFNAFLKNQQELPGDATMTLALFNHLYTVVVSGANVEDVPRFTEHTYVPDGMTALLDAVGFTIESVSQRHASLPESERPIKVVVAILTDGHENSSQRFSRRGIFELIGQKESQDGWEFVYLGVGPDAIDDAEAMGIRDAVAFQSRSDYVASFSSDLNLHMADVRMSPRGKKRHLRRAVPDSGDGEETLSSLFTNAAIRVMPGAIFHREPTPMPSTFDFDRIEGMMLGLAIGDSLGVGSESMGRNQRRSRFGEIRDYQPHRYAGNLPLGLPSDDSQLAFWTLDQLVRDGGLVPERLAERFASGRIFGIGSTVKECVENIRRGAPWYQCGPDSAGNGALMRIAPILIPHLRAPSTALWADTALCAMLTHNNSGSIAACLAFVNLLWELLRTDVVPEPLWWLDTYIAVARDLENDQFTPRGGDYPAFRGPIWAFLNTVVRQTFAEGKDAGAACDSWYSGAFLLETVPSAIYILMRHANDPEEAIVRAVNDTRDNDTVAAIVGAAVGALYGRAALPQRWVANLMGRTAESDDGRMFEILAESRARFGVEA